MKIPRLWLSQLPLRRRTALFAALTGALAALALATLTFSITRSFLLEQRDSNVESKTFSNAQVIRTLLSHDRTRVSSAITSARTEDNGYAVIHLGTEDSYYAQAPLRFNQHDLPKELLDAVLSGKSGRQRFSYGGRPYIAIGVNIAGVDAQYFEVLPQNDLDNTLTTIASTLAVGVLAATMLAGLFGAWSARRVLTPLRKVAMAAKVIASGDLSTRLGQDEDPDLESLIKSFNEMADSVQRRFEREQRFTSDVSHELRSPITALRAAIEVLGTRRDELSDRSQQALDVVVGQARRFDQMVLDLLELSRLDVGAGELRREEVGLSETVQRIASRYGFNDVPIKSNAPGLVIDVDVQILERALSNLLNNARDHAGGAVAIEITHDKNMVRICVIDNGPGVAPSERERIFERFARGSASRNRIGTGLGLALVAEHSKALGGRAFVSDMSESGSKFCIELPAVLPQ